MTRSESFNIFIGEPEGEKCRLCGGNRDCVEMSVSPDTSGRVAINPICERCRRTIERFIFNPIGKQFLCLLVDEAREYAAWEIEYEREKAAREARKQEDEARRRQQQEAQRRQVLDAVVGLLTMNGRVKLESKITAIKHVRAITGLGLKEAKDMVEATMPAPPVTPSANGVSAGPR